MKLLLVAKVVLVLWIIRDIVVSLTSFPFNGIIPAIGGTIGYVVLDVRAWLLVIGILVLRHQNKVKPVSDTARNSARPLRTLLITISTCVVFVISIGLYRTYWQHPTRTQPVPAAAPAVMPAPAAAFLYSTPEKREEFIQAFATEPACNGLTVVTDAMKLTMARWRIHYFGQVTPDLDTCWIHRKHWP
jgi:hypothetical protein